MRDRGLRVGEPDDPATVTAAIYPRLVALAHTLGCGDEAEDAAQEALVETLRRHPDYVGLQSPAAYTRLVLVRVVGKRRPRWRPVPRRVDECLAELDLPGEDETARVVSRLWANDLLGDLPLRQRRCVYLTTVWGFSDRQAGDILGCRPSTVRSNVARALRGLGLSLKDMEE